MASQSLPDLPVPPSLLSRARHQRTAATGPALLRKSLLGRTAKTVGSCKKGIKRQKRSLTCSANHAAAAILVHPAVGVWGRGKWGKEHNTQEETDRAKWSANRAHSTEKADLIITHSKRRDETIAGESSSAATQHQDEEKGTEIGWMAHTDWVPPPSDF